MGRADLEELLALGGAVHLRRLVKLPGDVLQGGHIYDQVKTNTGVHHDADNGYFTECGIRQPLGDLLDPKRGQDQVDGSVAAEQEAEHGRQGYHTGNIGHEEAEPVELLEVDLVVDHVGKDKGQKDGNGGHRHGVENGVAQGHLEFPVTGKELDKIVKGDKFNTFQAGEEVPLRKRPERTMR